MTGNARDSGNSGNSDNPQRLRAGAQVRVVNPRSPHYGATGHVIGRGEHYEPGWLIRFATTGQTVRMHDEELVVLRGERDDG